MLAMTIFTLILLIVPASCVVINEPSFSFKVSPWLTDLKISENGTFAACCNGRSLVKFDVKDLIWQKNIGATCLDIKGDYLVVGAKKTVYLYDKDKLVWRKNLGAQILSVSVSPNGYVAVGCSKEIFVLDKNGSVLVKVDAKGDVCRIAISNCGCVVSAEDMLGRIYILLKCNKVVCGSKFYHKGWVWTYINGWYYGVHSRLEISYPYEICISGKNIIVSGGEFRNILTFNEFGYPIAICIIPDGLPVSLSVGDGLMAVGCENGLLYVFENGKILWKVNMLFGPVHVAVSENGKFVAASSGKKLVLFDRSGKILWIYDNFDDDITFVCVSNNGRVVAGTSSGYVYAFKSKIKPIAEFDYSPKNPMVGEKVTFIARGGGEKYIWDFGDGKRLETNKNVVEHVYNRAGTYKVTLMVVSDMTNSTSKIVIVKAKPEPKVVQTPKPTPTPTKQTKHSFIPKIPGFKLLAVLFAIVLSLVIRKR